MSNVMSMLNKQKPDPGNHTPSEGSVGVNGLNGLGVKLCPINGRVAAVLYMRRPAHCNRGPNPVILDVEITKEDW